MSEFAFKWSGHGPLDVALKRPIRNVALSISVHENIHAVKIYQDGDNSLEIYSEMHDIAPRDEVGVLNFFSPAKAGKDDRLFSLARQPTYVRKLIKLCADTNSSDLAESGLIIELEGGGNITIVAASFPCSLAVFGVPGWEKAFDPEYPMERYIRADF